MGQDSAYKLNSQNYSISKSHYCLKKSEKSIRSVTNSSTFCTVVTCSKHKTNRCFKIKIQKFRNIALLVGINVIMKNKSSYSVHNLEKPVKCWTADLCGSDGKPSEIHRLPASGRELT
ncbi:hypothetical protein XENORESO_020200 [Xenotaenia resolanae]|uniref:Uncharacterized protein n=1 Tax=Xenotaenia resolanae TaxID=208358 RepID=A0ABV0VZQ7_9TELE